MTVIPSSVPGISLAGGVTIPQVGYGVYQVPPAETARLVETALQAGYRHIDTAKLYDNETGVGAALAASAVPREDVFVTTKVWNTEQGREATLRSFDASMSRLGLEQLDLFLIHWPAPRQDLYVETWRTLVQLREEGRVRAVGVSNFEEEHLRRIIAETGVTPAVNQIELHPYLTQQHLRELHAELGIVTEAWSPLGQGHGQLDDPVVRAVAARVQRTPAQVVLRWHLQLGVVVIPKSATPSRIAENLALTDFVLSDEDMAAISGLERDGRHGPHPSALG